MRRPVIYVVVDTERVEAYFERSTKLVSVLASIGSPAARDILDRAGRVRKLKSCGRLVDEKRLEDLHWELIVAIEEFRRAMEN